MEEHAATPRAAAGGRCTRTSSSSVAGSPSTSRQRCLRVGEGDPRIGDDLVEVLHQLGLRHHRQRRAGRPARSWRGPRRAAARHGSGSASPRAGAAPAAGPAGGLGSAPAPSWSGRSARRSAPAGRPACGRGAASGERRRSMSWQMPSWIVPGVQCGTTRWDRSSSSRGEGHGGGDPRPARGRRRCSARRSAERRCAAGRPELTLSFVNAAAMASASRVDAVRVQRRVPVR